MLTPKLFRILTVLFASASLVAFTGCGGDDDKKTDSGGSVEEYKKGAEDAANDFKNSAESASEQVKSATSTEDKIKGLESLKASVTQAADDFENLDPPEDVKADNDQLVQEFRSLASDVDAVEQALKSQDQQQAQDALTRLSKDQSAITQTIARIESKIGK